MQIIQHLISDDLWQWSHCLLKLFPVHTLQRMEAPPLQSRLRGHGWEFQWKSEASPWNQYLRQRDRPRMNRVKYDIKFLKKNYRSDEIYKIKYPSLQVCILMSLHCRTKREGFMIVSFCSCYFSSYNSWVFEARSVTWWGWEGGGWLSSRRGSEGDRRDVVTSYF